MGERRCRVTVGAWSWPAVLGLLVTFDSRFVVEGPVELREAAHAVAGHLADAGATLEP